MMQVAVQLGFQNPSTVTVLLPDWSYGGTRDTLVLSLFEALQLRAELNRVLP